MRYSIVFAYLVFITAGCATSSVDKSTEAAPEAMPAEAPAAPASAAFPEVTLSRHSGTLGELVRVAGEQVGGGLVLMHGLEPNPAPELALSKAPFARLAEAMAQENGLAAQQNPFYYFIHLPAPVYAPLLALELDTQLPPKYHAPRAAVAFGGGTALYNVLGSLSKTLGLTLVADNILSESPCGELTLPEAPLPDILEAVFKSALLPAENFRVEATDEYLLFSSARSPVQSQLMLNTEPLTTEQQALLDRRMRVELPRFTSGAGETVFFRGAARLRDVLPVLSEHLGIKVEASPALQEFPVTWTVMEDVRVRTALELLIRQWPMDRFGYELRAEGILIRERA